MRSVIRLNNRRLTDDDAKKLYPQLAVAEPVEIDLSENMLTSLGVMQVLARVKASRLEVLKLYKNEIDDSLGATLVELLRRAPNLSEIHLSHNLLTEYGAQELVEAACETTSLRAQAAPMWIRLEHNCVDSPMNIYETWARRGLSVCNMEGGCSRRRCMNNRNVHTPHFGRAHQKSSREVCAEEAEQPGPKPSDLKARGQPSRERQQQRRPQLRESQESGRLPMRSWQERRPEQSWDDGWGNGWDDRPYWSTSAQDWDDDWRGWGTYSAGEEWSGGGMHSKGSGKSWAGNGYGGYDRDWNSDAGPLAHGRGHREHWDEARGSEERPEGRQSRNAASLGVRVLESERRQKDASPHIGAQILELPEAESKRMAYSHGELEDTDLLDSRFCALITAAVNKDPSVDSVTEVDLSSNCLVSVGLTSLLGLCLELACLRKVKLYSNKLVDAGANALSTMCKRCRCLDELHVSDNYLTGKGAEQLVRAASLSPTSREGDGEVPPFWLRLEQNCIDSPAELFRKWVSEDLRVCMAKEGCTPSKCGAPPETSTGRVVHLKHFLRQRGSAPSRAGNGGGGRAGSAGAIANETSKEAGSA